MNFDFVVYKTLTTTLRSALKDHVCMRRAFLKSC